MKNRFFISIVAAALLASCSNENNANTSTSVAEQSVVPDSTINDNLGVITFDTTSYDFGTVQEGEIVEHVFKFTNTGKAPVILAQVSASCGCTTPSYTKEPILPGKEGEIKVSFDSNGQLGNQQKIVTVVSNAENKITTVQIKGTVQG